MLAKKKTPFLLKWDDLEWASSFNLPNSTRGRYSCLSFTVSVATTHCLPCNTLHTRQWLPPISPSRIR